MTRKKELRLACLGDIKSHVVDKGYSHWKPLLVKWLPRGISRRLFFYLVAEVKEGVPDHQAIKNAIAKAAIESEAQKLPVVISPRFIAQTDRVGLSKIEFLVQYRELMDAAKQHHLKSLTFDDKGHISGIENAHQHERAIILRKQLLRDAVATMKEVAEIERIQKYVADLMRVLEQVVPQDVREILGQRLAELNAAYAAPPSIFDGLSDEDRELLLDIKTEAAELGGPDDFSDPAEEDF